MRHPALPILLFAVALLSGCGFAQSLRKDAYGNEEAERSLARGYGDAAGRKAGKVPAPVTVMDHHVTQFSGEPVDMSGIRAKKGHITRSDFDAVANRNDNSLWKEDGQQNYFFSTNKAKMPGDLVTIEASKELRNDIIAEFRRCMLEDELEAGVVIAGLGTVSTPKVETKPAEATSAVAKTEGESAPAGDAAAGAVAASSATPDRAPASSSAEDNAPLNIVAEVVNRYPNGNVLIRGIKRFAHNGRNYSVEVTGITRANDISEEDRVSASKFFEYKTEMFR